MHAWKRALQDLAYWLRGKGIHLDQHEGFAPADRAILDACRPDTLTSPERLVALVDAARYVVRAKVPGAFVECGVWRGGSSAAIARTLVAGGILDRELHLFDTFEGMPRPGRADIDRHGLMASERFRKLGHNDQSSDWDRASIDIVRATMERTGYPMSRMHFVRGLVEETLPREAPERIALLRLDTDWESSTRHELEHLFPRLSLGGVLIVDDYGHWQGARKAVDEYFRDRPILLCRIDYTGRLGVKVAS